jgi:hypothetical protein
MKRDDDEPVIADDEQSVDAFYDRVFELSKERVPKFGVATEAIVSDFSFVCEPGEQDRRLEPSYEYEDDEFRAFASALPNGRDQLRRLRDPPPSSASEAWGYALGLTAAAWQLLGLPGALQLGDRMRRWMRAKKGRTGNATALLAVAIHHVCEQRPSARPDPLRVQVLDPCEESPYPAQYLAVYLYRIYDQDGERVYVVEVASDGVLVHFSERKVGMFEAPSPK